jgi:hypothetical protein
MTLTIEEYEKIIGICEGCNYEHESPGDFPCCECARNMSGTEDKFDDSDDE